ncbi:MAG: hypothetical protein LBD20_06690 [Spirochaetaceae bacterium]|jgi:hypothetical protein|nr:hypothetical protein [Spirochaetaceae bacterium]
MERKWRKAIAVVAMVLASGVLFAESNRSSSTAGRFGTDVDDFLDPTAFGGVLGGDEPKSFFAYTRLGRGTLNGNLELGAATKIGELLYIAAFYNGWFQFDGKNTVKGKDENLTDSESVRLNVENRSGKPFEIDALVGIGSMGIKLIYEDNLNIVGTQNASGVTNTYLGSIKPAVDVGFASGVLSEIRLSIDFHRDETITQTASAPALSHSGNSIASDTTVTTAAGFVAAAVKNTATPAAFDGKKVGSYVEPELYLSLGFGSFGLENSLALRFFTNSAADKSDGEKHDDDVIGLAWWNTSYNAQTGTSSSIQAVWDNKFYLSDTITPAYALSGKLADEKFEWKVKALLPITLTFGSDDFSAKVDSGGSSTKYESFYKASSFDFGIVPTVKAAVSYRPHDVIGLHAGVQVSVFDWSLTTQKTEKVDLSAAVAGELTGMGLAPSGDSASSDSTFTGPGMTLGAGATFYLGPCALDLVLLKGAQPTVDGVIYEAISGGLKAAVVISAKF